MIIFRESEKEKGVKLLNNLARQKMKMKVLQDIKCDLIICEIENWNKKEYLLELNLLINELTEKIK